MPSDTGQYFDQLRTEFQAGCGEIDIITGDVIWPAQFAANGYILDLKYEVLEGGKLPPRRSLYEDQEVLQKVPAAKLNTDAIIENSTPRPISPYYSDKSLELAEQYNAAFAVDVSRKRRSARQARALGARIRARLDAGPEEIEEDAQDGEGRDGEDHAGQTGELAAADHGQEHDDRVNMQRLALDARGEEVALELLDENVGDQGEYAGRRRLEERERHRRYRPEKGPEVGDDRRDRDPHAEQ
jgi:hypothetical protein